MSTHAQVTANQSNAQHSTGPKTVEGKAAVAQNNFRHGFTAVFRVTGYESQEEYNALHLELAREYAPQTLTEEMLVQKMAQSYWLRNRALFLQNVCTEKESIPHAEFEKKLALYIRYQTTHDRAFHTALNTLLKLRAEKRKAEIGFESQERKRKEEARREAEEARRAAGENRTQELHQWAVMLAEAKVTHQQTLTELAELPDSSRKSPEKDKLTAQKAA